MAPPTKCCSSRPRTILKTSSGKIRRAACRKLYEQGLLEAPRHAVWLQLAQLLRQAAVASLHRGVHGLTEIAYGIYCWLVFLLWSGGGLIALALLPTQRARYRFAHIAAKTLVRALGIPLTVEGIERLPADKPGVIVVNHASYIDAMVLVAVLPSTVHFAAKREFARIPLFGFVLRRLGTHFVERVDPVRGVEDTRELTAAAVRGETFVFFPEGTFSRAPGLAAFRLGAFVVSAEANVPIIPIVLLGTRSVLREHRWLPARYPVVVSVQPSIVPSGCDWSAAIRLRDQVREVMLRNCGEPDLAR